MTKRFVSGVGEWASHSVNIQTASCSNDCRYCYAKANSIRFGKTTAARWKDETINPRLVHQKRRKLEGTVMAFTQHDITPANVGACAQVLVNLLMAGNKVLIVSKPHLDCTRTLCESLEEWKPQILFRFTIGSSSDAVLKKWEPNAPSFDERIASLKFAHACGYQTSVSCEPMLDRDIDKVIIAVRDFVTDAIWLGKPNKIVQRVVANNPNDPGAKADAEALEALFTDEWVMGLYNKCRLDPKIKWKDSIKAVVGLERSTRKGTDK